MTSMPTTRNELDELDERIGVLAAQIHALEAELVDCLAELDQAGGWHGWGFRNLAQWVSLRTKLTPADARRLVTVAGKVVEMPTLMADARRGALSVGVLAKVAPLVTEANESHLADVVRACTPAQAERVLGPYRRLSEDEPALPDEGPQSWCRRWTDRQGRVRYDLALDPLTGELFEQARQAVTAQIERDRVAARHDIQTPVGERSVPCRPDASEVVGGLASTVLEWASRSGVRDRGGERFAVQVSCDLETLAAALGVELDRDRPIGLGARAYLPRTGDHLPDAELVAAVAAGTVQLLIEDSGEPLWIGTERRLFSRHQRRALRHRAGGVACCEVPGCGVRRFVDAHHIVPVHGDRGPTDLDNGVLLCGFHHRMLHREGWKVTRSGTQITFWTKSGTCLGSTGPPGPQPGPPAELSRLPFVERVPDPPPGIDPDTAMSGGCGEPLTRYGIDVLLEKLLTAA